MMDITLLKLWKGWNKENQNAKDEGMEAKQVTTERIQAPVLSKVATA